MNPRPMFFGDNYRSGQPVFFRPAVPAGNFRRVNPCFFHRPLYMGGPPQPLSRMISPELATTRFTTRERITDFSIDQLPLNRLDGPSRRVIVQWLYMGTDIPSEQHVIDNDIKRLRERSLAHYYHKNEALIPMENKAPNNDIILNIIYEDADVVIFNKPSRLLSIPTTNDMNSLMNGVIGRYAHLKCLPAGGLVHRLDFDTSGACMVALSRASYNFISLNRDKMKRTYWCIVDGVLNNFSGTITEPVPKRGDCPGMQDAVTHFKTLEFFANHTLVECKLETGRLNQIRIHMKSIGHPIIGDKKFNANYPVKSQHGSESDNPFSLKFCLRHFSHTALHAIKLSFEHPRTGKETTVMASVPYDFNKLLSLLRQGKDESARLLDGLASVTRRLEADLLVSDE